MISFTASSAGTTKKFTLANNGNIAATGTITGLQGITSAGTIQFSGFTSNGGPLYTNGTGVLAQTPAGNANQVLHGGTTPTFSAVDLTADVTGTLPVTNGGTGINTINTGDLLYGSASNTLSALPIGTENQLLSVSNTGVPTWVTSSAFNFFQKADGVISPLNTADDFILGSASTASAKFAFINNAAGTPTASIAAQNGSGSALSLNPNSITTQNDQTLTLGGPTTGNVQLVSGGTTALTALANGNVGIGTAAPLSLFSVGNNSEFQVNSAGSIAAATGIISSGTIQFSGLSTGVVQSSSNGTLSSAALNLAGGTQYISGILPVINGGSPFEETNGAITERIPTEDVLFGGTATASAEFGFLNVNSGTPTASISGANNNATSLIATGVLGTTNAQTLQLGNATTGNISLIPGGTTALTALTNGNVGIGTTAPTSLFSVGNSSQFQVNSFQAPSLLQLVLFPTAQSNLPALGQGLSKVTILAHLPQLHSISPEVHNTLPASFLFSTAALLSMNNPVLSLKEILLKTYSSVLMQRVRPNLPLPMLQEACQPLLSLQALAIALPS